MANAPRVFGQQQRKQRRNEIRGTNKQRGYDEQWNRISRMKRQQQPICEICKDAAAEDVDHIQPFKGIGDPLRLQWSNLQSVCRKCHNAKTHGRKN